jgi:GNAT superfamily N-acetyltransferase
LITDLSSRPHLLPRLADSFFAEWPEWCHRVGRAAVEDIFVAGEDGALPLVLVALEGETYVGTIALRPYFADEPMPETPWVRQLLVLPAWRGRGVDRLLIEALARRARGLGYGRLYAATNRIERLLARRGWEVFARVERDGEKFAWMRSPPLTGS